MKKEGKGGQKKIIAVNEGKKKQGQGKDTTASLSLLTFHVKLPSILPVLISRKKERKEQKKTDINKATKQEISNDRRKKKTNDLLTFHVKVPSILPVLISFSRAPCITTERISLPLRTSL